MLEMISVFDARVWSISVNLTKPDNTNIKTKKEEIKKSFFCKKMKPILESLFTDII